MSMHNVAPSRALARRSRQLLTIAFVVAAVGVFVAVAGVALFVIQLAAPQSNAYSLYTLTRTVVLVTGIIIFLIGLVVGVRAVTLRTDNDYALTAGKVLAQYFDQRYHFIRNINKRDLGYIDAVLIGPPGVLVFRILRERGSYANEAANWLKRNARGDWSPAGISPTKEAVTDIKRLREFLAARSMGDVPVFGAIVFIGEPPTIQIMAKDPVVPVSTLAQLTQTLTTNYLAKERIDAARVTALARLLYDA